jgi:hypothetical protein
VSSTSSAADSASASWFARSGRRHLPFAIALLGGVAIRWVVTTAYQPALVFPDTFNYVNLARHPHVIQIRSIGYSLVLWPLQQLDHSLVPIVVFHHLIGLGLAVLGYIFLVRRGLPAWGATLAMLPVLFDPLQLVLEQFVLSDVVFTGLIVGACLLLLWKPRPPLWAVVLAGAFVGASALVRGAGTFLLVVFVVAAVSLRLGWVKVVALVVGAVVPLGLYATAYHSTYGVYALSQGGPRFLYARLAPDIRCQDPQLHLPAYEKELCPTQPVGERPDSNYYMWHKRANRDYPVHPPPGITKVQAVSDFTKRVVRAQPGVLARGTMHDFLNGFSPSRNAQVSGFPAWYWQFQDHYWMRTAVWHPTADPGKASFLQAYRERLWTPGPLLGLLLLVSAVATLGFGRARRCGDRVAIGLLAGSCLVTLLTGAALSGFSWRYQLPQLSLLPMAGALAIAALVRGPAPGRPAPTPPLRLLDRTSSWLSTRVPRLRPAHERGVLPVLLAVVAGIAAGVVTAAMAVRSGWFRVDTGSLVGLVTGVLVVLCLVVAHRRTANDVPDDVEGHTDHTPATVGSG